MKFKNWLFSETGGYLSVSTTQGNVGVEYWENPDIRQIWKMAKKTGGLRGLFDGTNLIVWVFDQALHNEMYQAFKKIRPEWIVSRVEFYATYKGTPISGLDPGVYPSLPIEEKTPILCTNGCEIQKWLKRYESKMINIFGQYGSNFKIDGCKSTLAIT